MSSLDITKVFDKLKPIEKRQKEAEAYFRNREKLEKKVMEFDYSIKSKLFEKKTNFDFDENLISKTSAILKKILEINPQNLFQISYQSSEKSIEISTQTEDDEFQTFLNKVNKLEEENEKLLKKNQKYIKEIEVCNKEIVNLRSFISKLEKDNKNSLESIEKLKKENEIYITQNNSYSNKIKESNDKNEKTENLIEEYNNMKSLIEERINIENERQKLNENQDLKMRNKYSTHIYGLVYFDV